MIIELAVKLTALLGTAWIAAHVLRSRAASTRHALWIGVMTAALALPAIAAFVPAVELPWLPQSAAQRVASNPASVAAAVTADDATARRDSIVSEVNASEPEPTAPVLSSLSLTQALIACWLAIGTLLVIRVGLAHARAARLLRGCTTPSAALTASLDSVAAELGVTTPRLRIAASGMMPAVIGTLRPSVVLPEDAESWTAERLRLVLLHECAHVRRRDSLLQVIANVAAAAYWWHPLAWVAKRGVVRERELACDDLVIACGTPGEQYAEHLIEIARSLKSSRQPALAALAMARPSELEGRLIALLEERPRSARPARALGVGVLLAAAAVALIAPVKLVARAVISNPGETINLTQAPSATPIPEPAALGAPAPQAAAEKQNPTQPKQPLIAKIQEAGEGSPLDPAFEAALLNALNDTEADVRGVALRALARSTSPQALAALQKGAIDADEDIRQVSLLGLIERGGPDAAPLILKGLQDESEDVRTIAVMGLRDLDHPEKRQLLLRAAMDASEDVRTVAAIGLASIEGDHVNEMLIKLSTDASPDVRQAAILAIARKSGHDGGAPWRRFNP
jgi:beta-lactamase regulating signal transducer with metallopeptidase domain